MVSLAPATVINNAAMTILSLPVFRTFPNQLSHPPDNRQYLTIFGRIDQQIPTQIFRRAGLTLLGTNILEGFNTTLAIFFSREGVKNIQTWTEQQIRPPCK